MPTQLQLDKTYIKMADTWGQLSKANRRKVGCIIAVSYTHLTLPTIA